MTKKLNLLLFFLVSLSLHAQGGGLLIPRPQSVTEVDGFFLWDSPARLVYKFKDPRFDLVKEYLASLPESLFSFTGGNKNTIKLIQDDSGKFSDKEAYRLIVNPGGVEIRASSAAGIFYGIQTLLQLRDNAPDGRIQCMSITDRPVLGYRGFMLDVSRHFFPKEFIFKQIDMLSSVKINVLHLHLTDTGGWRVEIKKYPQLTQTSWRTDSDWRQWIKNGGKFCDESASAYGGYYTQDDIREIIHYAAVHQMEVIPEIDIPGHSSEVLTVMPELLCQGNPHKGTAEMCLGNEKVYRFCEDVLDEIIDLFPSRYIHIGGDECGTAAWSQCPLCQEVMKKENVPDPKRLQARFTKRMESYVSARGKTIIGWDEMLDGEISPKAVIMSWHEDAEGRNRIISSGHPMIISSEGHFYLDYYQDYPVVEPICFGGFTPLKKSYEFDPFEDLSGDASLVMGMQCNLWTEAVETPEHAEHMMYPRILAMAETSWHGYEGKDYSGFKRRVLNFQRKMERMGYTPFDISNEFGAREESGFRLTSLSTGKPVTFATHWSEGFPASGKTSLTDGLLGDWGMNGLRWLGFDANMDVTVDLHGQTEIHSIRTSFMQNAFTGMYLPEIYEISVSTDGEKFDTLYSLAYKPRQEREYCIEDFGWSGEAVVRYIRIVARHPSGWCWLMCDEIIVR